MLSSQSIINDPHNILDGANLPLVSVVLRNEKYALYITDANEKFRRIPFIALSDKPFQVVHYSDNMALVRREEFYDGAKLHLVNCINGAVFPNGVHGVQYMFYDERSETYFSRLGRNRHDNKSGVARLTNGVFAGYGKAENIPDSAIVFNAADRNLHAVTTRTESAQNMRFKSRMKFVQGPNVASVAEQDVAPEQRLNVTTAESAAGGLDVFVNGGLLIRGHKDTRVISPVLNGALLAVYGVYFGDKVPSEPTWQLFTTQLRPISVRVPAGMNGEYRVQIDDIEEKGKGLLAKVGNSVEPMMLLRDKYLKLSDMRFYMPEQNMR